MMTMQPEDCVKPGSYGPYGTLLEDDFSRSCQEDEHVAAVSRSKKTSRGRSMIVRWMLVGILIVATLVVVSVRLGMNINGHLTLSSQNESSNSGNNNSGSCSSNCCIRPNACATPKPTQCPSPSPALLSSPPNHDILTPHVATNVPVPRSNPATTTEIPTVVVATSAPSHHHHSPVVVPSAKPTTTNAANANKTTAPARSPVMLPLTSPTQKALIPTRQPIVVPIVVPMIAPVRPPLFVSMTASPTRKPPTRQPIVAPVAPVSPPLFVSLTASPTKKRPISTRQPVVPPVALPISPIPIRIYQVPPTRTPVLDVSRRPTTHAPIQQVIATTTVGVATFYAIGDVPYTDRQVVELTEQMLDLPRDAEFVIHVGDVLNAKDGEPCRESAYQTAADILKKSHAPVFIVLGDNDWNDCAENRDEALGFWRKHFLKFESRYWNHTFAVVRQPNRMENFAFVHCGSLFIGLNLVGGEVHSESEWETRLTDQIAWTKKLIVEYSETLQPALGRVIVFGQADPRSSHDAFFKPLQSFVQNELANRVPILYMNGDRHFWQYEPNFMGQSSFLRIMVTGQTVDPPLKVMVHATGGTASTKQAFVIDRRL